MARHLKLNPITCDAHGMCAELLPELITLDDWGYPIIADGPIPPELEALAKKACDVCPTLALKIERRADAPTRTPRRPAQRTAR